jgi:hypothetical protein
MSHSRMMAENFGISILESDAKLLHERIQLLIAEAYNRGIQYEREACAKVCDELDAHREVATWYSQAIRARGEA